MTRITVFYKDLSQESFDGDCIPSNFVMTIRQGDKRTITIPWSAVLKIYQDKQ